MNRIITYIKSLFDRSEEEEDSTSAAIAAQGALEITRNTDHFVYDNGKHVLTEPKANYLNKYTEHYEEAIINEHITAWDVMKICSLNGIRPEIGTGWYPLVINLFIELDKRGWNRRVSCIKEKFAELTVYFAQDTTLTNKEDWRALMEKYELASKFTCETCGKFGRVRDRDSWQYTACREHYHMSEQRMEAYDTFLFVKEGKRRWSDLRKVEMELDYFERPRFLRLEFSRGLFDYLRSSDFGFGRLISRIPQHVRHHFDATVLEKYAEGAYCQVCGIQSYYNHTCEACEFTTFSYCSPDRMASYTEEEIKEYQLEWYRDGAELFYAHNKIYPMNPDYIRLVSDDDWSENNSEYVDGVDVKKLYHECNRSPKLVWEGKF